MLIHTIHHPGWQAAATQDVRSLTHVQLDNCAVISQGGLCKAISKGGGGFLSHAMSNLDCWEQQQKMML